MAGKGLDTELLSKGAQTEKSIAGSQLSSVLPGSSSTRLSKERLFNSNV